MRLNHDTRTNYTVRSINPVEKYLPTMVPGFPGGFISGSGVGHMENLPTVVAYDVEMVGPGELAARFRVLPGEVGAYHVGQVVAVKAEAVEAEAAA